MKKVIVIGGGAAGMAAALAAAGSGASAVILEKNEKLGKKLFITGKGRCNLTNAADMKEVQDHVVSNPRFLFSAFRAFTNADIMRLVEENGCPLKTERGARVFPVSDHSWDVINALERALKKAGVSEDDVCYMTVSEDCGDGRQEYDVEFCVGIISYSCSVDAATGTVNGFYVSF